MGPSSFDFDKIVLLNDVSHLLFLLFPFVRFFFQIRNLFTYIIKSVRVWRTIRHRSDERGIWILERLQYMSHQVAFSLYRATHSILFLARKLARSLKVDPKVSIFAFIIFTGILDRVNVEGHSKPLDRQNDCLCFTVNENL